MRGWRRPSVRQRCVPLVLSQIALEHGPLYTEADGVTPGGFFSILLLAALFRGARAKKALHGTTPRQLGIFDRFLGVDHDNVRTATSPLT